MHGSALRKHVALFASVGLFALPAPISDLIGVYAIIDRVVIEPEGKSPKTIQIWGVFAFAEGSRGDEYGPAQRGYLYYRLDPAALAASMKEWSDLKSVAGTGGGIGFGARWLAPSSRVRRASEPPADPDIYPTGIGVARLGNAGGWRMHELSSVPEPTAPPDGRKVAAGPIRLAARNVADTTARYVFEIEGGGAKETSEPILRGKDETAWTPKLTARGRQEYTWRVWVVSLSGNWKSQAATASFRAVP